MNDTVTDPAAYEPPKVWTWDKESGGRFASINRPIAGATHEAVKVLMIALTVATDFQVRDSRL